MSHITGPDCSQTLLLPEALDDYVALDNPVRFIDAFVAALNDYLQRLDQSDAAESGAAGSRVEKLDEKIAALRTRRDRCAQMQAALGSVDSYLSQRTIAATRTTAR
jgi:hypothetical protein